MKIIINYLLRGFFRIVVSLFILVPLWSNAQAVTEIITDYGGYWKSSTSSINSIKPDNSHNLLAFTFNGMRYSTGVNDDRLSMHGDAFTLTDFRALPVSGISGAIVANTKIGLGALYDGVLNGASSPPPTNNIAAYLTDGPKGLNLGTGAANLPVGTLSFSVTNLQPAAIGDAKPDILVTQFADPSTTLDRYEFTDAKGIRVGNFIDISFSAISSVGNWTADFYEASQNPMALQAGFTQTDRPIRLWAADLSAFGIDAGNYNSIAYFKITLGGNSDVAFVAYNNTAINVLPVKFSDFYANKNGQDVDLVWQTQTETNTSQFVVEHSLDGNHFSQLGIVSSIGKPGETVSYSYKHVTPSAGTNYYRLKEIDKDGNLIYSKIVSVSVAAASELKVTYRGQNLFLVTHPVFNDGYLKLMDAGGNEITIERIKAGSSQAQLDLNSLSKGIYYLMYFGKGKKLAQSIVVH